MKLLYIYWTLLFISFVSSGLLFIIVASEASPAGKNKPRELTDNTTIRDTGQNEDSLESSNPPSAHVNNGEKCNEDTSDLATSGKISNVNSEATKKLDVLTESLNQQPNLSQGISETGQAVVLTLVDTTSAELQSLAEPHLSPETQAQGSKNHSESPLSSTAANLSPAAVPTVLLPAEEVNSTDEQAEIITDDVQPAVVIVRAEQKPVEDILTEPITEKPTDDDPAPPFQASSELDDGAARIKVVGGSSEEAATAILDSLVTSGTSEHHEDIPSFSEWAQKRLEEAEKKKTHPNASIQNPGGPGRGVGSMKMRSKNYASPDCGAKIVAVNPEARSARSVLVSTRDEYMLNTCTSRIWFVVELCEAIQAKKIELANFELFSSSPRDFSVYVSDRFPTRDWSGVGHFTAKDERDIQSFALHPQLFGKFIKVELHSHYGSEHFCPISLFRAYGTSEFEVLETETDVQETSDDDDDDDDDEEVTDDGGDSSRNLFGSATDVVFRIVKKAAEVLVQSGDSGVNNTAAINESIGNNIDNSSTKCTTLRYTIICANCTDNQLTKVFQLLSCRMNDLETILKISFINQTFYHTELCQSHGVDLRNSTRLSPMKKKTDRKFMTARNLASFITSVLPAEYIVSLCNVLAFKEGLLVVNSTHEIPANISSPPALVNLLQSDDVTASKVSTTCQTEATSVKTTAKHVDTPGGEELPPTVVRDTRTAEVTKTLENLASQIKPTKTLGKEDLRKEAASVPILESSKDVSVETVPAEAHTTLSPVLTATATIRETEGHTATETEPLRQMQSEEVAVEPAKAEEEAKNDLPAGNKIEEKDDKLKDERDEITAQELSLDTLLSELEADPSVQTNSASVSHPAASSTPQQKESVFLRLSNRIKALERNMSLSSQYLEELSRRYKKQVEEMQRSLERATATMGEEFKKSEERDLKRLEEVIALREEVSSLTESMDELLYDRNSWRTKLSTFGQHIALIFIEIVCLILIISYCRRSYDIDAADKPKINKAVARRKSADSIIGDVKRKKKPRRPSEIASKITGTYRELLIDSDRLELRKERKKKKRRDSMIRLGSNIETRRDGFTKISPSRRASSVDCWNSTENDVEPVRPESAPDVWCEWPEMSQNSELKNERPINIDELDGTSRAFSERGLRLVLEQPSLKRSPRGLGILKSARLHSQSFMRTALQSRSKRDHKSSNNNSQPGLERSDNWEYYSGSSRSGQDSPSSLNAFLEPVNNSRNGGSTANGHHEVSDDSASGNASPTPQKTVKKEGGFRKIVRKLF